MRLGEIFRIGLERNGVIVSRLLLRYRSFERRCENFDFFPVGLLRLSHGKLRHTAQVRFELLLVRNEISERPVNKRTVSRRSRKNSVRLDDMGVCAD